MLTANNTVLRSPRPTDSEPLARLRNDVRTQTDLLALPRANSDARVTNWMARLLDDPSCLFFVIADATSDGAALGFIQLQQMDFVHGTAELGVALLPEARGRGHAAAAIAMIEAHARDVFRIRKVVLRVRADNRSAISVYHRCGYVTVGTLTQHVYSAGVYHDVLMLEHLFGTTQ